MKLPGVIYDRMVQNMRAGPGGDWEERECDRPGARERRLRQRQKEGLVLARLNAKDCMTFNPMYQAGEMRGDYAAEKKPEPVVQEERLFGDPPEHGSLAQQWSNNPVGVILAALFLCASIATLVALLAYGPSGDSRAAQAPIEVEK